MKRFRRSLLAVLLGQAAYFGLSPWLPEAARHKVYCVDLGLLVDFWFCLACYGLLGLIPWFRRRPPVR